MFKILLFIFLFFFIIFRVGGFVLRLLFGSMTTQRQQASRQSQHHSRPKGGNVSIDSIPTSKGDKKTKDFKGGDYVDFEELK